MLCWMYARYEHKAHVSYPFTAPHLEMGVACINTAGGIFTAQHWCKRLIGNQGSDLTVLRWLLKRMLLSPITRRDV